MNIELLPFHRLGQAKYDALNIKYKFENVQAMAASAVEAAKEQFYLAELTAQYRNNW